jgi:hypothetical protein
LGRASRHLETFCAPICCTGGCILNQSSSDAASHPIRFDEQPVELVHAAVVRYHDGKADRRVVVVNGDADPAAVYVALGQFDRIRVRRELFAVRLPYVGGSTLQGFQRRGLRGRSVSDPGQGDHSMRRRRKKSHGRWRAE